MLFSLSLRLQCSFEKKPTKLQSWRAPRSWGTWSTNQYFLSDPFKSEKQISSPGNNWKAVRDHLSQGLDGHFLSISNLILWIFTSHLRWRKFFHSHSNRCWNWCGSQAFQVLKMIAHIKIFSNALDTKFWPLKIFS